MFRHADMVGVRALCESLARRRAGGVHNLAWRANCIPDFIQTTGYHAGWAERESPDYGLEPQLVLVHAVVGGDLSLRHSLHNFSEEQNFISGGRRRTPAQLQHVG